MDLTGEFHVPLPREAVFDALNDPEILGRCIPGCQTLEQVSDTEFDADVLARVGAREGPGSGPVSRSRT